MKNLFKPLALWRSRAAVAIIMGCAASVVQAGLLETQSNPVLFGSLYWGNPTNWDTLKIPHYQLDTPGDGTHNRDINFISIAHDAYYFYIRINFAQAPYFNGSDFFLWLDTDLNPSTGTRNWTGNGSIGSEYVVSGGSLIRDPGGAYDFQGWINWDDANWTAETAASDVIVTISRQTLLPGIKSFNFTYQLYNSSDGVTGDWYPDSADSQTGDFFRYTVDLVPGAAPTSSSDTYKKVVLEAAPLAYYRLSQSSAPVPEVATNTSALGVLGNGKYTLGAQHAVAGAILGDTDTAARFSAVDTNSTDGGVPVLVPWPEKPMIRELWDNLGYGVLKDQGSGSTSLGFDESATWHVNLGDLIKVSPYVDITAPPGPPANAGQSGGLTADDGDTGGLPSYWDTRSWATRQLAPDAQIHFDAAGEYWITVRIDNTGDTAMGVGLASGADDSAQFVGVGVTWNSATALDSQDAANALYASSGTLGQALGGNNNGPYAIQMHSNAGLINGPGLIVARLVTGADGNGTLEANVYQPNDFFPTTSAEFVPQFTYNFNTTMIASHLLVWLNGDTSGGAGQLDAIRVTRSFDEMFHGVMNTTRSFTIEAWLRPTLPGAGNAQSPLFNRDPNDSVVNRAGWDFFQRGSATGWNLRMFNGSGSAAVFDLTGGPYTVGEWCHLVAVYDATAQTATLYLNGQQAAFSDSPNGVYVPTPYAPLSIGGYSDASQNPFSGDIDEVAIYTNALDAATVLAHYDNGTNASRSVSYSSLVLSSAPVEYLRLDDPARNVATNSGSLGADADGVFDASVATAQPGPRSPLNRGFESDNLSASFDGLTSYIELRNPPGLNFNGAISLEAWVQPSVTPGAAGGFGDIIAHGYDEAFNEVALRANGNSDYAFANYTPSGGEGVAAPIPVEDLGTGSWVHLVGTFDGAKWNLYRNGTLLASAPGSVGAVQVLSGNWAIGARGRWAHMNVLAPGLDRQFQGAIDEPAIYDRALSAQEVLAHYYVGVSNNPVLHVSVSGTDLVLTWPVGTLQEADSITGPYQDVIGAAAPSYTVPLNLGVTSKFYRLKL